MVGRKKLFGQYALALGLTILSVVGYREFFTPFIEFEIDVPDYVAIPEDLRETDSFEAGAGFKIGVHNRKKNNDLVLIELSSKDGSEKQKLVIGHEIENEGKVVNFPSKIPEGTKPGTYLVTITFKDGTQLFEKINVLKAPDPEIWASLIRSSKRNIASTANAVAGPLSLTFQGQVCTYCNYEIVLAGSLTNPQNLVVAGLKNFVRSTDGGRHWTSSAFDNMDVYSAPYTQYVNNQYWCDPKVVARPDGTFFIAGLFFNTNPKVTGGGLLYRARGFGPADLLDVGIIQGHSPDVAANDSIAFDRPSLTYDPNKPQRIYVGANGVYFEDRGTRYSGLFYSQDSGVTFQKLYVDTGAPLLSLAVGEDGTLYGAHTGNFVSDSVFRPEVLRFSAITNPAPFVAFPVPGRASNLAMITNGPTPDHFFLISSGPDIVVDHGSQSPFRGRLYVVWAEPVASQDCLGTSNQIMSCGKDFNIMLSHSDDKAGTWSAPVKVNDDNSGADQFFPAISIDDKGGVHVAFVDHRQTPAQPLVDVFYALSHNGGQTFTPNLRLTNTSIPLQYSNNGGRPLGDYNDMVVGYTDKAFIAHPCVSFSVTDVCISEVTNSLAWPTPTPSPSATPTPTSTPVVAASGTPTVVGTPNIQPQTAGPGDGQVTQVVNIKPNAQVGTCQKSSVDVGGAERQNLLLIQFLLLMTPLGFFVYLKRRTLL